MNPLISDSDVKVSQLYPVPSCHVFSSSGPESESEPQLTELLANGRESQHPTKRTQVQNTEQQEYDVLHPIVLTLSSELPF